MYYATKALVEVTLPDWWLIYNTRRRAYWCDGSVTKSGWTRDIRKAKRFATEPSLHRYEVALNFCPLR